MTEKRSDCVFCINKSGRQNSCVWGLQKRSVAKRGDTKERAYNAPLSSPAASPGKGDVVVLLAEGERKAVIFSGLLTLLGDGWTGSLEAERFLGDGWI